VRLSCPGEDENSLHYFRCAVVSKLQQVTRMSGTDVEPKDRRDAELDYLRLNAKEWFESESDAARRAAFLAEHSNYPEIIAKHGEPARVQPKTSNLASRLLDLTIVTPQNPVGNALTRKLPKDMQVRCNIFLRWHGHGLQMLVCHK
jgi:hypothetical protein